MKDIVKRIQQMICQHDWKVEYEYDVLTGKMYEYRYCTKCGKVD